MPENRCPQCDYPPHPASNTRQPWDQSRHPFETPRALSDHSSVSQVNFLPLSLISNLETLYVRTRTVDRGIHVPECLCGGQKKTYEVSSLPPFLCELQGATSGREDGTSPLLAEPYFRTLVSTFCSTYPGSLVYVCLSPVQSLKYHLNVHDCYICLG